MAEAAGRKQTISEIAAEEVFERSNEVHCIRCREPFVVEELGSKGSWQCPHCERQNPNLFYYFLMIGVLFAIDIVVNLVFLVLYMKLVRPDIQVFYVMWAAGHMLLTGYALIAIYGDRHSYGLIPLRYMIPVIFASAVGQSIVYQVEFSVINAIVGAIIFGGTAAFIAYSYYLSFRMVEGHRAEESIIRPVYSMISIALNVVLLLIFTTIVLKSQPRTPGNSKFDLGKEGGYVPTSLDAKDVEEEIPEIEDFEEEDPVIKPESSEVEFPETREAIIYESPSSITIRTKKQEESVRKVHKQIERKAKYQQRKDRDYAREIGGGTDEAEMAVLKALRWLKKRQNRDGSWGELPFEATMTGVALLAFLGHGEDHTSEEFGNTVRSAIYWFVDEQDDKGYFAEAKKAYQHGIASYAMMEAYGMTGLEDLRPVVVDALNRIIEGQTKAGGWVYRYRTGQLPGEPIGDTSVTGWQVQALKAAHAAGITFSDGRLSNAMRLAINNLKRVSAEKGGTFGYTGRGGNWKEDYAMTAVGTLCMQLLGQFNSREVKAALRQMKENYRFDWKETVGGRLSMPLYSWYYATQAFYQATDDPRTNIYWKFWNPQMQRTLLHEQKGDGHWPSPAKSKEPTHVAGKKNAEVWSTALCCLMLEVYYRYLPTYRLVE